MVECEYLSDRKHAPAQLGRVLVLGLGKSGRGAVEYFLPLLGGRVSELAIAAGQRNEAAEEFAAMAQKAGAQVLFGDDAVEELAAGGRFDLCVASPGIPPFSPLYEGALRCCDEVMSEVELAWRESAKDSRWVAITGTNGKSTTVACAAHVLQSAGLAAAAVGNIGDTCIEAVAAGGIEVYVAEVSSYQLASTSLFAPDVAVELAITPDHLHWHGTLDAYRDAKLKLLANLDARPGAVAILDATDPVVREEVRRERAQSDEERGFSYIPLGTSAGIKGDMRLACGSENAAYQSEDGSLRVAFGGVEHRLLCADELLIKGSHNVLNALAAAASALALGVDDDAISEGLRSFPPLEHRIEPCGEVRGVRCYNDSKATNVDATLKALDSFPEDRVIVLLGGDDKGTDLAPLVEACHAHAAAAVCFGAAGDRFAAAFEDAAAGAPEGFALLRAEHLPDAFDVALGAAHEGDVVLLSPACASFDEFTCFEERGVVFKSLVAQRAAEAQDQTQA